MTDEGKKALTEADLIDDKYLLRYASFREFQNYNKNDVGRLKIKRIYQVKSLLKKYSKTLMRN